MMQAMFFAALLTSLICFFTLIRTENLNQNNDKTKSKPNVPIIAPSALSSKIFFQDQFQDRQQWSKWIRSQAKKEGVDEHIAKYDGEWSFELPSASVYSDDYALMMKSKGRHYAIAAPLQTLFDFSLSPLIVQYEVKFETNQECGGAYVKLLSHSGKDPDLRQLMDKTPYTIMFGPDMCGSDYKFHLIIRYRHPKTGLISEHQAKKSTEILSEYFTDKKTHLYKLVLSSNNTFNMFIDHKLINSGSLLKDLEPPIIPPKEITDPNDRKPNDWDDEEKIIDTTAKKPDDWDENAPKEIADPSAVKPQGWLEEEPLMVPDPEAKKPEDWDDEIDGTWEPPEVDNPRCQTAAGCGPWTPPMIPNPAYKGKWTPPLIDNPNYRGKWEPRQIPNPDYFHDPHPYHRLTTIDALALELWSSVENVTFDNFLITSDESLAKKYQDRLWSSKYALEEEAIGPKPPTPSNPAPTSSKPQSFIESLINAVKESTAQRPWIWTVSVALPLAPLALFGLYSIIEKLTSKKRMTKTKRTKPAELTEEEEEDNDNDEQVEEAEVDEDDENYEDEDDEEEKEPKAKFKNQPSLQAEITRQRSTSTQESVRRRTRKA